MAEDDDTQQGQDGAEGESAPKLKVKGAATKFFNSNPDLLSDIQSDINGRGGRLQLLQDRNKFLGDQMKMVEGSIKLYSTLNQTDPTIKVPDDLKQQVADLTKEISKNSQAYQQEFNNVKPLPPDPNSNDVTIDHNGKDVSVNGDLLDAVKKGDPRVIARVQQMQSSQDPQVREQAAAIGHALGQGIADQPQTMFRDNGEVSSEQVAPNAMTPSGPAGQPQAPSIPGQPAVQNDSVAVGFIKNQLSNNPMSTVGNAGPAGAVEAIRRQLLSNLQKAK